MVGADIYLFMRHVIKGSQEIDSPGHTAIIAASHPEFVACNQASPWSTFANEPPAGQLRLASPATVNFTADLFTAAAKVLPSKYFSTGGDELNTEFAFLIFIQLLSD